MPYQLDEDALEQLRRAQAILQDAKDTARRARACGIDCSAYDAVADHMHRQVDAMVREFGPRKADA